MKIRFEDVKNNRDVDTYITEADRSLIALGYTEHSYAHVGRCADTASGILSALGRDPHICELAKIAGYLHDIGNVVNREDHAQSGALMAFSVLNRMGADAADIAVIITAIGNHDEGTAFPVNDVAAALILADKTDVRRSRVRNRETIKFDIHDRVNFAAHESLLDIDSEKMLLDLKLTIDTSICSVMDYFEIFLNRMLLCRKAAEALGLRFRLHINGAELL